MQSAEELAVQIGVQPAVCALGVSRAGIYRLRSAQKVPSIAPSPRPAPPRALGEQEREAVLQVLHSDRFVDQAPAEVYATLLDEGIYHCSMRTMYRILDNSHEVKERRDQLRHPAYHKPELLATAPNQVWSWDITKLLGPAKWCYFYLYVILDVFSRYAVGWMVAHRESSALASRLFAATCLREKIEPGQLTIHADRGSSMKSKPVALLFADLGITKTHSRPHVSNDNPFSEAQFKTLKYRPSFPDRFQNIQHARLFCGPFFDWYNNAHRHAGIGLLTPAMVHFGRAQQVLQTRAHVLHAAFHAHPERFVNKIPVPPALPEATWINKPKPNEAKSPDKNSLNKNDLVSQNH
jgi:putative transposase